ncbi:trypsin-like peptidase domain-containing protein [Bradyrhizobium sp. CW4]|uniref:trypsin-like peptidase domain-containing protein n=1 Tax=Bradyrhizobium sp. CW4 TaxID=2782687 RepID=UPI001FF7C3EC|nr:trypsin-like peptidase domain-containing protein [Bradyrhizobium sp. CW4]MCK1412520.1 trypsin-like peptidase domain-containing protein [Bradyrhizobium sp. CW4]
MSFIDFNSLNGPQRSALRAALVSAYNRAELEKLLSDKLDKSWEDLVGEGNKDDQVFELIEASQRHGWTDTLIKAATAERPNNAQISRLEVTLRLMAPALPAAEVASGPNLSLERMIAASRMNYFSDLVAFQGRICRVEAGRSCGTGFLIASNLVLTNYHVVEGVKDSDGATVICRFDSLTHPTQLDRSAKISSSDWLPAYSPYAPGDDKRGGQPPTENELDFAVLRLDQPIGTELIGGAPRGWFQITDAPRPSENDAVLILQYPLDRPLSMSIGAVLDENRESCGPRIHYAASTNNGSSGSPVFSAQLELVALHHAGDPDADRPAEFNQGIPIGLIYRWLKKNRKDLYQQFCTEPVNSSVVTSSPGKTLAVSQAAPDVPSSQPLQPEEISSSGDIGAAQTTAASSDKQSLSIGSTSTYDRKSGILEPKPSPRAEHPLWRFLSIFLMPAMIIVSSLALRHLNLEAQTIPDLPATLILTIPGLAASIILIILLAQLWGDSSLIWNGKQTGVPLRGRGLPLAGVLFTVLAIIMSAWVLGLVSY